MTNYNQTHFKKKFFKIFHVAGLIVWLGPSSGGYWFIILSYVQTQTSIEQWLRKHYLSLIYMETAGLLLLIVSGLGMLSVLQWIPLKLMWMKIKLFIVILIFIPLESIQLYIYLKFIKEAFAMHRGIANAALLYDRFSIFAFFLLLIAVPTVLSLSIFKPGGNMKNREVKG